MEMFYATGVALRTKIIGAAILISVMLIVGGALGTYKLSQVMDSVETMHVAVKDNPDVAKAFQPYYENIQASYRGYQATLIVGVLLALILPLGAAVYFIRTVSTPLNRLVDAMQHASQGDLTVSLFTERRDEVGQATGALNVLMDELNQSIHEVSQAAEAVSTGAQELNSATDQLSSATQEQASSLEETAASMEEMTSTVKQNADNALQADKVALEAREAANEGVVMSSSLRQSMNAINASSTKIADIISVIDEIAFQTNLLALNAAVEAARAGEQGRGFAVVATEVRSLAQRSATAAKQIKTLIQDSVEKVQDGVQLVGASSKTLEGIVGSVKKTGDIIAEISASSQEQASGIEQVNRAIVQMDSVSQSNAAQVEELTGTSQSLKSQAERLRTLVMQFTLKKAEGASPVMAADPVGGMSSPETAPRKISAKPRMVARKSAGGGMQGFEEF